MDDLIGMFFFAFIVGGFLVLPLWLIVKFQKARDKQVAEANAKAIKDVLK